MYVWYFFYFNIMAIRKFRARHQQDHKRRRRKNFFTSDSYSGSNPNISKINILPLSELLKIEVVTCKNWKLDNSERIVYNWVTVFHNGIIRAVFFFNKIEHQIGYTNIPEPKNFEDKYILKILNLGSHHHAGCLLLLLLQ